LRALFSVVSAVRLFPAGVRAVRPTPAAGRRYWIEAGQPRRHATAGVRQHPAGTGRIRISVLLGGSQLLQELSQEPAKNFPSYSCEFPKDCVAAVRQVAERL
jgi:hypothetical protein